MYIIRKRFYKITIIRELLNKQEEKEQNIENEKVETEGFTVPIKDFADRELIEELQNMGFISCSGESSNESIKNNKKDRWCKVI